MSQRYIYIYIEGIKKIPKDMGDSMWDSAGGNANNIITKHIHSNQFKF